MGEEENYLTAIKPQTVTDPNQCGVEWATGKINYQFGGTKKGFQRASKKALTAAFAEQGIVERMFSWRISILAK